jgi:phosphoribosylanthranilate isomerase
MSDVRLKVCGITSSDDAAKAVESGAIYLGFNFYPPSPRYIAPELARRIVDLLPKGVIPVGIFVNEPHPDDVNRIMECGGMRIAQLHGDEDPEYCRAVGLSRVIKAFRAASGFQIRQAIEYAVHAVLLDAYDPRLYGGTGKTVDWGVAASLAREVRLFLAGGLSPDNIQEAVRAVHPWAVDLNSGVESAPGIKDATKLRLLRQRLDSTDDQ